jgi:Flp pilus assembly protein TadG
MRKKNRKGKRGAAIVELAVCLPVLVLMVWGTIEVAGSIFMKQTLTSAAHEGALAGMRVNSTESQILAKVNLILTARGVNGATVDVFPTGTAFTQLVSGDPFSIRIQTTRNNKFISLSGVSVLVTTQKP